MLQTLIVCQCPCALAVLAIRGTLSLDDCLTDFMCEPADLEEWIVSAKPGGLRELDRQSRGARPGRLRLPLLSGFTLGAFPALLALHNTPAMCTAQVLVSCGASRSLRKHAVMLFPLPLAARAVVQLLTLVWFCTQKDIPLVLHLPCNAQCSRQSL